MCASCGKLMGVVDECPYCGADNRKVGVRLKRVARSLEGGGRGAAPVTRGFVILNVFLFVAAIAIGGVSAAGGGGLEIATPDVGLQFRLGLLYGPAVDAGDWWRLIMPIFLHLGVLHVFFNSYILWVAGQHVEAEIGPRLMFLVYMAAGILGFVGSYFAGIGGAGASGAVSGLLGFLLVRRRLVDGDFRHPLTQWVIQLTVITAIFGLIVSRVNNVAHLVGFLTGGGFAWMLTRVRLSRRGAAGLMFATLGTAVATVAAIVAMLLSLGRGSADDLRQVAICVDQTTEALEDDGRSIAPERATRASECLATAPVLNGDAADAQRVMSTQLKLALDAHAEGDTAAEQAATSEILRARMLFGSWFKQNGARYGLPM